MRYVAAYLLASLGGQTNPSRDDIEKILSSVGIETEKERLSNVLNSLKGKNLQEIIAEGELKLANVPSGGGGGGGGASSGGAAAEAPAAEEKKEEQKEESEEESDDDMGFGLFD